MKAESPRSIAIDLTQVAPPISHIDRDEPRLEEEVQTNGCDSVIAVHDFLASSSSSSTTTPVKSKKVEEKEVSEPVLKKGKK
jgi:hypothetical protein